MNAPRVQPRFSVLVACYAHEAFVQGAIESVWEQSVSPVEIVAVDDGSPDGTGQILDALAARSPIPMTVIHTANAGASSAFNLAAQRARGDYLSFLNDDDLYARDRLDVFARAIDRCQQFGWGFSAVSAIDESGTPIKSAFIPDGRLAAVEASNRPLEALQSFPVTNTAVSSGNLVIGRGLFMSVGGFQPYRHIHDWDLSLRLYWLEEPAIMERVLYFYRVHSSNSYEASDAEAEVRTMRSRHRGMTGAVAEGWDHAAAERAEIVAQMEVAVSRRYEADLRLQQVLASRTWRYTSWYRSIRSRLRRG